MPKPGRYIVIEGLDGSGKTTQFERLLEFLGDAALGVREPGGTPIGEQLRTILKDKDLPRDGRTNMFLFAAARSELISTVVRPAITKGTHVVSDRNWLSTFAYQSAEGVDTQDIKELNRLAAGEFFEPSLVIFIDVEPKVCRERTSGRGGSHTDYFDSKGESYFAKVRAGYLEGITSLPQYEIVDGHGSPDEVWQRISQVMQARIG